MHESSENAALTMIERVQSVKIRFLFSHSNEMSHGDSWKHEELPRQSRLESSAVASCRLLLSNVFYEVSEAELALLFEQVGPLQSKPSIRVSILHCSNRNQRLT